MDDQLTRKANLFRLGFPITKIPMMSMHLTSKDRFQELKDIMRHNKLKDYQTEVNENDTFSVIPLAAITSNDTGKKRPDYETLMSRPRHFSQGHYMNVKSDSDVIDLTATVSPQVN